MASWIVKHQIHCKLFVSESSQHDPGRVNTLNRQHYICEPKQRLWAEMCVICDCDMWISESGGEQGGRLSCRIGIRRWEIQCWSPSFLHDHELYSLHQDEMSGTGYKVGHACLVLKGSSRKFLLICCVLLPSGLFKVWCRDWCKDLSCQDPTRFLIWSLFQFVSPCGNLC